MGPRRILAIARLTALAPNQLESAVASLIVSDANGIVNPREKNFAVPDFPGPRRSGDCLHGFFDHFVGEDHFEFDFGYEVHRIFPSPVKFCVPLLPSMAARLENRHANDANLMERVLHRIELRGLDDCFDLYHGSYSQFSRR